MKKKILFGLGTLIIGLLLALSVNFGINTKVAKAEIDPIATCNKACGSGNLCAMITQYGPLYCYGWRDSGW
jgi:hypothetical protein